MKRTFCALAAVAVSAAATVAAPAFAAEPAANVDVSDGSSKGTVNADINDESQADLFKAFTGLLISTAGALNGASVPTVTVSYTHLRAHET